MSSRWSMHPRSTAWMLCARLGRVACPLCAWPACCALPMRGVCMLCAWPGRVACLLCAWPACCALPVCGVCMLCARPRASGFAAYASCLCERPAAWARCLCAWPAFWAHSLSVSPPLCPLLAFLLLLMGLGPTHGTCSVRSCLGGANTESLCPGMH